MRRSTPTPQVSSTGTRPLAAGLPWPIPATRLQARSQRSSPLDRSPPRAAGDPFRRRLGCALPHRLRRCAGRLGHPVDDRPMARRATPLPPRLPRLEPPYVGVLEAAHRPTATLDPLRPTGRPPDPGGGWASPWGGCSPESSEGVVGALTHGLAGGCARGWFVVGRRRSWRRRWWQASSAPSMKV